jgi:hypothetical protein
MSCSQTTGCHRFPTPSYELNCQGCVSTSTSFCRTSFSNHPGPLAQPYRCMARGHPVVVAKIRPKPRLSRAPSNDPWRISGHLFVFSQLPINFSRGKGTTSILPPHSEACYWAPSLLRNGPSSTVTPPPQSNRTSSPQPGNPNTAY